MHAERVGGTVPSELMQLQRSAGNRAVGALLARDGEKGGDAKQKGDAPSKGGTATLVMPDPIGVIIIDSYSLGGAKEIRITAASSAADPKLVQASTNGTLLGDVTLSAAGHELVITEAIISSAQVSDGHIAFTLSSTSIVWKARDEPDGPPEETGPDLTGG